MFFHKKIKNIKADYKVLEIGPGSSPHPRSNAFLELDCNPDESLRQRGGILQSTNFDNKPLYMYKGNRFPFEDNEFDYIICSHVIEHVANPIEFMQEAFRVGSGRGYIEYPLITYEYSYNFDVHLNFMKLSSTHEVLYFLPKSETGLAEFFSLHDFFRQTLTHGWNDLCATNKLFYFEGFEFDKPFSIQKADSIQKLIPSTEVIQYKKILRKIVNKVLNTLQL